MDTLRSIALILFLFFFFSTQNIMFSLGMKIICKESERTALLSFKKDLLSFNQELYEYSSNSLPSWSGENCCRWAGVVCNNRTDHVVQLQLQNLELGGKLNPSLQELKQLRHLDLSLNKFQGISIPDFLGSLQSLKYLNLSHAGFSGMIPHQLGNLSRLRYLDIHSETFTLGDEELVVGNFQWISHLSSLHYLDLSYVNLKNASNWFHAINMLPSLLALRLSGCHLSDAFPSLPYVNFTSLAILDLSSNYYLNSTLPEWLYSLTNLEQLDLSRNSFQGTISPSIGNLTKLTLLDLSYNQFGGEIPIALGNLWKLQFLNFQSNQLEGEIPTALGNLCKLQSLNFQSNQLSGRLPNELGRLRNLNSLLLTDNKLNGSLPKSLGNLSNLVELSITKNANEGVVSEVHFANLTNLQYLLMDSLVLKFSPEWVPPFQLIFANLSTCQLGPGFPVWLRTQKNLEILDLSRTGISGKVPTWFWKLPFNNLFSGIVFYSLLDLSHNELHGELPKVLSQSTNIILRSNQFNGQLPRVSPHLMELDLSNNSLSGSISTFLCNPISKFNGLRTLDLSDNLLTGGLSDCWFHWTSLVYIKLGENKIKGKLPSSIGSLLGLEELHLNNNILSGELPSSLRNCTFLNSIDLGGNGFTGILPTWLGESLLKLRILRLRSNKFCDEIPLELCNLTSLRILDIAHNGLRGSIPRCFNKFSAMATNSSDEGRGLYYFGSSTRVLDKVTLVMKGRELEYYSDTLTLVTGLDLSKNSLSGEIPEELTSLLGLRSLNLSDNRFTGKIPEKIGNMILLESLDFSKNRISGVIPQSISGLHFLSNLNLAYNNFSGKIPLGTQLQSFNESSYIGNQELCGLPLIKYCNGEEPLQKPGNSGDKEVDEEDWFEMKWFYMSMRVGFAVGFWVFWGVMLLKSSWRIAYFLFLDDMKEKLYVLF